MLNAKIHPQSHFGCPEICFSQQLFATSLSQTPFLDKLSDTNIEECLGLDEGVSNCNCPLKCSEIDHFQQQDDNVLKHLQSGKCSTSTFNHGGGKSGTLIAMNGKIATPSLLQKWILEWHHTFLLHPGSAWTEETLRQHFHWLNVRTDVREHTEHCRRLSLHAEFPVGECS